MSKIVRRPFCTIFKRSETEKKMYNMSKEFEGMKSDLQEINSLKAEVQELKEALSKQNKSTSTRKSSK